MFLKTNYKIHKYNPPRVYNEIAQSSLTFVFSSLTIETFHFIFVNMESIFVIKFALEETCNL